MVVGTVNGSVNMLLIITARVEEAVEAKLCHKVIFDTWLVGVTDGSTYSTLKTIPTLLFGFWDNPEEGGKGFLSPWLACETPFAGSQKALSPS